MEECIMMRDCTRKLALWHTKTFKPIMTHDELEPIMATLGFVALPRSAAAAAAAPTVWKEYAYCGRGRGRGRRFDESSAEAPPPRPRLPYNRIDGLHIYAYQAFIDALAFYLTMPHISDVFHIRGMPLHRIHDRNKKLRRMKEDDSIFVYREGTLDQATYDLYHVKSSDSITNASGEACPSLQIRNKDITLTIESFVPLHDLTA